jgi:hypothetical protein
MLMNLLIVGLAAVHERVYGTGTAREFQDSMTTIILFFSSFSQVLELPCVHRDEEPEPLATTLWRVLGRHTSQAQSRNQYLGGFETPPRIWGVSIVELF